jgi:hypothetical protein
MPQGIPGGSDTSTYPPDVSEPRRPAAGPQGGALLRFAWQSGGLILGRGAGFITLVIVARSVGSSEYGRFAVVLALVEFAAAPWSPTVLQGAASGIGKGGSHAGWRREMGRLWLIGAIIVTPIVGVFAGWTAAAAVAATTAINGLMVENVPHHLLAGRQRTIAIATSTAQIVRLVGVLALLTVVDLTPAVILFPYVVGYAIGAILLRTDHDSGAAWDRRLDAEYATDILRVVQSHGPVLVIAWLLGLGAAGGFDLLFRLAISLAEVIAGVGLIVLPDLVEAKGPHGPLVARGIRLPLALALVVAVLFAVAAGPLLAAVTDSGIEFGFAPAFLALTLLLAPYLGVARATLVVVGGAAWIMPSQLAVASATLGAAAVGNLGLTWAAAAIGVATVIGAGVLTVGLRSHGALPRLGDVADPAAVRSDVARLRRR